MAISNQISRLTTLRNSIRTKLIGLGILPAASSSATLSECYSVLSNVIGLGASSYTPTTTTQTIPSGRYLSGAQTINAIPSAYIIPSGTSVITGNGVVDVASYASASINVQPALQSKTVTPTESVQNVTPDANVYGLSKVTVNAIPSTYLIPTGTSNITSNGLFDIGSYKSVSVSVYQTLQSKTVTPTQTVQDVVPDQGVYGLSKVTVNSIPSQYVIPFGTLTISESGVYDVASYASADVTAGGPSEFYAIASTYSLKTTATSKATGLYCYNVSKLSKVDVSMFAYKGLLSYETFSYISYIYSFGFNYTDFSPLNINSIEFTEISTSKALGKQGFEHAWLPSEVHIPNVTTLSEVSSCFAHVSNTISYYFDKLGTIFCDYIFDNNRNMTYIYAPKLDRMSNTGIFRSCTKLQSLTLSSGLSMIGKSCFENCQSLVSINLYNTTSLNDCTFISCIRLTDISASMLTTINGGSVFGSCSALSNIYFPELTTISGMYAFWSCISLKNVSLPKLTTIGGSGYAFGRCYALESLYFPNITTISVGTGNFISCTSLSNVKFDKISILSGSSVFTNCYNLISMFFLGSSVCTLGRTIASMFGSTPVSTYSTSAGRWASIFVPSSLLASYKAATNWTTISSKIFAYEDYFDANGNPL